MTQETWLHQLTSLNKARNNAPHKPLLLLVFLEMVENGEYAGGPLRLTPELSFRFDSYFSIVQYRRPTRPDARMPFHHLKTDGFWTAHAADGTPSPHRSVTEYVVPNAEFVSACHDPEFRRNARLILISTHFDAAEKNAFFYLMGLEIPADDVLTQVAFFTTPNDAEIIGRTTRFRLDIVPAYNYTCALTGYRVTTVTAGCIVDAAHIHQFANSRNNDPSNGIALCKNAHWQFDIGLWSIDDEYRVIVANEMFSESSPNQRPLSAMQGQQILLPQNQAIWPSQTHLAWHRKHKFMGPA